MSILLNDYDFDLPEELIAQYPADKREESKLMVVDRVEKDFLITEFKNIEKFLPEKGFLVLNNTKVIKSRLLLKKKTGGNVEIFFVESMGNSTFKAMTKGRIRLGEELFLDNDIKLKILSNCEDNMRIIEVSGAEIFTVLERFGHIPLPPYIKRTDEKIDEERYQTVYAKHSGSVAAPTAGLHFSEQLLNEIKLKHEIVEITLNVGIGTFKPVKTANINEHKMHSENFYISEESFNKINSLKSQGYHLVSVGTTTTRCLESVAEDGQLMFHGHSSTDIFIKPGYNFRIVDHLITNFHLPKSTLFILVSTFAGLDLMKKAYKYAIENRLRFFSYGDAMLIL